MSIVVNDLRKSYRDVRALRGTSFYVGDGELFVLLGAEGSGKSAVISCLSMVTTPDSGNFTITGRMGESLDLASHLGVVFQSTRLDPELTVRQNIAFHASLMGMTAEDWGAEMDELAFRLDLVDVLNRRLSRLTPGEQRRTDIARAVIHRPQVLLMDEPVKGLDPTSTTLIWKLITDQREMGTTILLATDQPDMAAEADTVGVLVNGKIVAQASPAALVGGTSVLTLRLADPLACREELDACGIQMPQADARGVVVWTLDSGMARDVISVLSDKVSDFSFQQGSLSEIFKSWTEQPVADDEGPDEESGHSHQEKWVWNGPVIAEVGFEDSQDDEVDEAMPEARDGHVIAGLPSDDDLDEKVVRDWPPEEDVSDQEDTLGEDDFAPLANTWTPTVGSGGARSEGGTGATRVGGISPRGRVYPIGEGKDADGKADSSETSQSTGTRGDARGRQPLSNGQDGDMGMRYGETGVDRGTPRVQQDELLNKPDPVTSEKWNRARRFADTGRRMQGRRAPVADSTPAEDVDPFAGAENPATTLRGRLQPGAGSPAPGLHGRSRVGAPAQTGVPESSARRPVTGQQARSAATAGQGPMSAPAAARSGRGPAPSSATRPGQTSPATPGLRAGQPPMPPASARPGQIPPEGPGLRAGQPPAPASAARPARVPAARPGRMSASDQRPGQLHAPGERPGQASVSGSRPDQPSASMSGARPGQPPVPPTRPHQSPEPAPETQPWQPPQLAASQSWTSMFRAAAEDSARQDRQAAQQREMASAARSVPQPSQASRAPTRTPEARATPPLSATGGPALRSFTVRALAVPPTPWPRVPSSPRASRPADPAGSATAGDSASSREPWTPQPTNVDAASVPASDTRTSRPGGPDEDKARSAMDSWGSLASRLNRAERPTTGAQRPESSSDRPATTTDRPAADADHPTSSSDLAASGSDRPAPSSDSLTSSSDISLDAPNWGSLASRLDRTDSPASSPDSQPTPHRWPPMPGEEDRAQPASDRWPPLPSRLGSDGSAPAPDFSYGEDRWPFRTGGIDDPLFGRHRGSGPARDSGAQLPPAQAGAPGEPQDRLFVMSRLLKDAAASPALPSFDELFPSERLPFVGTGDPDKTHFFRREAALTDELRRPVDEEMAKQARIQLAVEKRIAAARNRREGEKSEDE